MLSAQQKTGLEALGVDVLAATNKNFKMVATTKGGDTQKREKEVVYQIGVAKQDTADLDAQETANQLMAALKLLAPNFSYEVKQVNANAYRVMMTEGPDSLNDAKPDPEVQQQLSQTIDLWANKPDNEKSALDPYNNGFAAAIEGLPKVGRGTWFSHNLVKSAMTRGIVVRGAADFSETLLAKKQIRWKPDESLPYQGTPSILIGHELVHAVTNANGENLPHRKVVAYENLLRYEHNLPMRKKYSPNTFWIAGWDGTNYVPLIFKGAQ